MCQAKIRPRLILNKVLKLVALLVALSSYVRVRSHEMIDLLLSICKELTLGKVKLLLITFTTIVGSLGRWNTFAALLCAVTVPSLRCC